MQVQNPPLFQATVKMIHSGVRQCCQSLHSNYQCIENDIALCGSNFFSKKFILAQSFAILTLSEVFCCVFLCQALEESAQSRSSVRDSGYSEGWFSDREELFSVKQSSYRREDSVESLDSVESRTLSVASDFTLRAGSEGKTALCLSLVYFFYL